MPEFYPKEINEFISSVRSDLIGSENKSKHSNMTKEEWEALDWLNALQKDGKIVIQPADKNGGICVIDRVDYIEEANRQLTDSLETETDENGKYYEKSSEKKVKDQYNEIKRTIEEGVEKGYFSKELGKIYFQKSQKQVIFTSYLKYTRIMIKFRRVGQ